MKSRISLCNGTILKKDLTRFAPLMLLTGLILWAMGSVMKPAFQSLEAYEKPETVTITIYPVLLLGLVSAITLFTYLTKKRECDAIHALPVRRETLLMTKILAAFLQFAVPFGIFYIFFPGNRGWGFQMLVSLCTWLFFFGAAVFSMMLVGRRLAGYIVFTLLIDLLSTIYLIVDSLYIPLLPGVFLDGDLMELSPTTFLMTLDFQNGSFSEVLLPMLGFGLLGLAFLALSWITYRRRRLERAGDFLAVKWLEPVLAWMLGITVSIVTIGIAQLVDGSIWLGLAIGLTIGYFAARMFFARTIKVFGKRSLVGWAALVAVMAASLYLTSLDPLGIVERVPETAEIESVTLYDNAYAYYDEYSYALEGDGYTTADPAEIGQLRTMHRNLIALGEQEVDLDQQYNNRFYLVYNLKNGTHVRRTYYILGGEELKQAKYFMSQPENLLGTADLEALLGSIGELHAYGVNGGIIHTERAFLEVFLEECEAGWMYTPDPEGISSWTIDLQTRNENGQWIYRTINVPLTAQKTIAWLEDYFSEQG